MNYNTIKKFSLLITIVTVSCFAQQNSNIEGSPNFRSLSGIANKEGKKIKAQSLYRSGNFSKLSESDVKTFNSLNINTIVDFRNDEEITKDPDFIPQDQKIKTIRATIGTMDNKAMGQFMQVLSSPVFKPADVDSLMINANKNFVKSIHDYQPFFEAISQENTTVLFHCSAGKDRTGLASSLLLHILDVSKEEIFQDYLRSNEAASKLKINPYGIPADRMAMLMGVKSSYLEAAWNTIIEKYGSIDEMLLKEFGINNDTKQKIKNKYLTN
jgi:protein-tyrosine phosphatase